MRVSAQQSVAHVWGFAHKSHQSFLVIFSQVIQLEHEAREKLRREAEHRRQHIMALRKKNLDSKASLSSIRRNQGINKSWVFSYYVHWPRETQER